MAHKLKNFKGFELPETEILTIKEIENLIGEKFNFEVKDNHIISLSLYNKELTTRD